MRFREIGVAAFILSSGIFLSQLLVVAATPILTRIFPPTAFGEFSIFLACLGIIGPVTTLRYDLAVPLARGNAMARHLAMVASASSVAIAVIVGIGLFLYDRLFLGLYGYSVAASLWLLPLALVSMGLYRAWQAWAVRLKSYRQIATARIVQSIVMVLSQLGLGFAGFGPVSLAAGQVVNNGAGFALLSRGIVPRHLQSISGVRRNLFRAARAHWRFPRYSVGESLLNSGAAQVPILIVAAIGGKPEAGLLLLAMRVLGAPLTLIGQSVSQIFLGNAAEQMRSRSLASFTGRVVRLLAIIGIAPITAIAIAAPTYSSLVFGRDWEGIGVVLLWMAPSFVLQLLSSPVSTALHALDRQMVAMRLQSFAFLFRVGTILIAAFIAPSFLIEVFAVSGAIFYTAYILVVFRVVGMGWQGALSALWPVAPAVIVGAGLGMLATKLV